MQHGATIGILPSLHKCATYSVLATPANVAAQQTAHKHNIQQASTMLVTAGTPLDAIYHCDTRTQNRTYQAMKLRFCRTSRRSSLLKPSCSSSPALQHGLAHFSRNVLPPRVVGPLAKVQAAVEKVVTILNVPADPSTTASMGLNRALVRTQSVSSAQRRFRPLCHHCRP
jgi:hypothetical protein